MPGVRARGRAAIGLRGPSSAARSSDFSVVLHFPAIAVSFGVFLSGIIIGICIVLIWIFAGVSHLLRHHFFDCILAVFCCSFCLRVGGDLDGC